MKIFFIIISFCCVLIIPFYSLAQEQNIFNRDRLIERHSGGIGIKAFTSKTAYMLSDPDDESLVLKELPAFSPIFLIDYYEGKFGVYSESEYGFIDETEIIVDFKIDSYKSVWESSIKAQIRDEQIRRRRQQRENAWQRQFGDTPYATDSICIDKSGKDAFVGLHYSKIVAFNFNLKSATPTSVIRNGMLNETVSFPGKELNAEQIKDLIAIINDTSNYGGKEQSLFDPKIGVVLFSDDEQIQGFIDVDLDHQQLKATFYVPSRNYHNKTTDDPSELVRMTGFSKKGKQELMEFFRKLKLNVSSYPPVLMFGAQIAYTRSGYYNEISKIAPSLTAYYGRNSLSLGPKFWLGRYYSFSKTFASGFELNYKYFITPYGRIATGFAFYNLDYGFIRNRTITDYTSFKRIRVRTESFLSNCVGLGGTIRIYKSLSFFGSAGIGFGLSSLKLKMENTVYPNENYENYYGFFKGAFFDSPTIIIQGGLTYRILN